MIQLQRFDLLFVYGTSMVGRVISELTDSPFSHVSIYLNESTVVETDWSRPFGPYPMTYQPSDFEVFRFIGTLTHEQQIKMMEFLVLHMGTPYDFIQSITEGVQEFVPPSPLFDSPKRFNCSEAAAKLYRAGGIELPTALTPGELSQIPLFKRVS